MDYEDSADAVDTEEDPDRITVEKEVNENREGDLPPFKDGVIEITEDAEVPVVSKEPRVVEEISINKEIEEHTEKVKDSVRRNEVDVEKLKTRESND